MRQRRTWGGTEHISYSPSGRQLVGRDSGGNVTVWGALTLEPVERIVAGDPREKLLGCLFRPGGLRFLREQGYVSAQQDLPAGAPRAEHNVLPGPESQAQPGRRPGWAWSAAWRHVYTQHFACFGPDGKTFVGWHPGVEP